MRANPIIIGLLTGLIVLLLIGGVSFLVKINALSADYQRELSRSISLEKTAEELKSENSGLKSNLKEVNNQLSVLKEENVKLEKLKERLEENLKEELMKKKLAGE